MEGQVTPEDAADPADGGVGLDCAQEEALGLV